MTTTKHYDEVLTINYKNILNLKDYLENRYPKNDKKNVLIRSIHKEYKKEYLSYIFTLSTVFPDKYGAFKNYLNGFLYKCDGDVNIKKTIIKRIMPSYLDDIVNSFLGYDYEELVISERTSRRYLKTIENMPKFEKNINYAKRYYNLRSHNIKAQKKSSNKTIKKIDNILLLI